MSTYETLPSGKLRKRIVINGKRVSFIGRTQKEIRQKITDYISSAKTEVLNREDPKVKNILETYIQSKEGVLSPATIRGYRAIIHHFKPIYDIRLSKLTAADIQYLISDFSGDHSAKSTKNLWALLSAALSQISDKKYKITLPTLIHKRQFTPNDEQIRLFMEHATGDLKVAVMLSAFGTLRRGELCALKYSDLDRENNTVTVHADMVYTSEHEWVVKAYPKTTTSIRTVIYPPEVIDLIPEGPAEKYIINQNPAALYNRFRRLCEKLDLKGMTIQSLRRYAASSMHSQGIPNKYIQAVGGWSSDQTLKRVYENTLSDQEIAFNNQRVDYISGKFFGHGVVTGNGEASK